MAGPQRRPASAAGGGAQEDKASRYKCVTLAYKVRSVISVVGKVGWLVMMRLTGPKMGRGN